MTRPGQPRADGLGLFPEGPGQRHQVPLRFALRVADLQEGERGRPGLQSDWNQVLDMKNVDRLAPAAEPGLRAKPVLQRALQQRPIALLKNLLPVIPDV